MISHVKLARAAVHAGGIRRNTSRSLLACRTFRTRSDVRTTSAEGLEARCYSTVTTVRSFHHPVVFSCDPTRTRSGLADLVNNNHQHLQRRTLLETGRDQSPNDGNDVTATEEVISSTEIKIPGAETGGKKLAIVFTCTRCNTRSVKQFSEKAYTQGVVIATCPGCQSKHLIADNLGYFSDEDGGWNIQTGMERLGEHVKVATNDNVLELSLEEIFTAEAIEEAVNEATGNTFNEKDTSSSSKDS